MATLEDKLMGEKLEYYCSSSEDEDEGQAKCVKPSARAPESSGWSGNSENTGPKGVLQDYERYKEVQAVKMQEMERQRIDTIKKNSITGKTKAEEEELRRQEEELDAELAELMDEEILRQFQKQRISDTAKKCKLLFGDVIPLMSGNDFLKIVEKESETLVIVHIFEQKIPGCKIINECMKSLAEKYKTIKFCKIAASTAGMSSDFQNKGLPAILVYRSGQLIGNFVRILDELGDNCYPSDMENFLIEKEILRDDELVF